MTHDEISGGWSLPLIILDFNLVRYAQIVMHTIHLLLMIPYQASNKVLTTNSHFVLNSTTQSSLTFRNMSVMILTSWYYLKGRQIWGCALGNWGNNCGVLDELTATHVWQNGMNIDPSTENSFRVNTKWLHILLRSQVEVISFFLFVCGVQRGRKRRELRKQHELEDRI